MQVVFKTDECQGKESVFLETALAASRDFYNRFPTSSSFNLRIVIRSPSLFSFGFFELSFRFYFLGSSCLVAEER
jgi:hypothetical protein